VRKLLAKVGVTTVEGYALFEYAPWLNYDQQANDIRSPTAQNATASAHRREIARSATLAASVHNPSRQLANAERRSAMLDLHNPMLASGSLPNEYQEVLSWKVTENLSRVILAQALALLSFFISGVVFAVVAVSLGKLPLSSSFAFGLSEIGVVLVGVVLTLVVHELTHGVVMQLFGAKPTYGLLWKGMLLYATSPGYAYHRNNYIVIALAPFVGISTLVVLGMWFLAGTTWVVLLAICGVVNASGAIGDIWMTMIVLRYAPTAYIMDERAGIRVFLPIS